VTQKPRLLDGTRERKKVLPMDRKLCWLAFIANWERKLDWIEINNRRGNISTFLLVNWKVKLLYE
jgi:hypothetical protein